MKLLVLALAMSLTATAQEQTGDPTWRPVVAVPAYAGQGPLVRVDEAHGSVQTIDGRYAGFAALLRADGYRVDAGLGRLDAPDALAGVRVLVISNPARLSETSGSASAFDEAEMDAVVQWVADGGSLLLAADHAPHGAAAQALGERFGVKMGLGYAFVVTPRGPTANLDFEGEGLGGHPVIAGRSTGETVNRVRTFTGQSIAGPVDSTPLLFMPSEARETVDQNTLVEVRRRLAAGDTPGKVIAEMSQPALEAQAVAFTFGKGRVVVLGEAGMLTAQIVIFADEEHREPYRFGLNTTGHDDQQFTLNALHWLSGLIP